MRPYATAGRRYAASSRWICTTAKRLPVRLAKPSAASCAAILRSEAPRPRSSRTRATMRCSCESGTSWTPSSARRKPNGVAPPVYSPAVGLVLKHRRGPFADLVALQLRGAGHHGQEELPGGARRVDRRAPKVDQVQSRPPRTLPGFHVRQTVRAKLRKRRSSLNATIPDDPAPPQEVEKAQAAGTHPERLRGAHARILDDLGELQAAHRAVGENPCLLGIQANALATLLLAAYAHVASNFSHDATLNPRRDKSTAGPRGCHRGAERGHMTPRMAGAGLNERLPLRGTAQISV